MHIPKKLIPLAMIILLIPIILPISSLSASSIKWSESYGATNAEIAFSVVQASDNGFLLVGKRNFYDGSLDDFWLVKTGEYGDLKWDQTIGGDENDVPYCVITTSDGGFALVGFTDSFGSGDSDFWLVKTDSLGNVQWNQTYGGSGTDCAQSVIETSDGGFALVGFTDSFGSGDSDFWLVKTDSLGNMVWDQTFGGTEADVAYSGIEASDGGFALVGFTDSFGSGDSDFWLVKTDSLGN
ncbi:MAG: hypothetical protein P8X47_10495, partial [Ignavibacteriaceae bacterium]